MTTAEIEKHYAFELEIKPLGLSTSITALGQYKDPQVADLWRKFQSSVKN